MLRCTGLSEAKAVEYARMVSRMTAKNILKKLDSATSTNYILFYVINTLFIQAPII